MDENLLVTIFIMIFTGLSALIMWKNLRLKKVLITEIITAKEGVLLVKILVPTNVNVLLSKIVLRRRLFKRYTLTEPGLRKRVIRKILCISQ